MARRQKKVGPKRKAPSKAYRRMLPHEVDALHQAMLKHGRNFAGIKADPEYRATFTDFTDVDLANKYSHMCQLKDERFAYLREQWQCQASMLQRVVLDTSKRRKDVQLPSATEPSSISIAEDEVTVYSSSSCSDDEIYSSAESDQEELLDESTNEAPKAPRKVPAGTTEIIQVFDVEADRDKEGRLMAQFNVQLQDGRRRWLPRGALHPSGRAPLDLLIDRLSLKLKAAKREAKRLGGPASPSPRKLVAGTPRRLPRKRPLADLSDGDDAAEARSIDATQRNGRLTNLKLNRSPPKAILGTSSKSLADDEATSSIDDGEEPEEIELELGPEFSDSDEDDLEINLDRENVMEQPSLKDAPNHSTTKMLASSPLKSSPGRTCSGQPSSDAYPSEAGSSPIRSSVRPTSAKHTPSKSPKSPSKPSGAAGKLPLKIEELPQGAVSGSTETTSQNRSARLAQKMAASRRALDQKDPGCPVM